MTEENTKQENETVEETPVQETPAENQAVEETTKDETPSEDTKQKEESASTDSAEKKEGDDRRFRRGGNDRGRGRGGPRGRRGAPRREKPEFDQQIVSLRRVTRVMGGGRRFSFSAAVVIGDRKGRVGFGIGKANDTSAAIDKAVRSAKKNMLQVKRTEEVNSIPFDSQAKYKASEVYLRPVSGKGIAAGGAVRTVLELAGIDEVGGKLLSRSKNNINNAKATLLALLPFATNRDAVKI